MSSSGSAVEARDLDGLAALLSDDIVFRSPVVHAPYQGRDQAMALLGAVVQVFEDFRYTREIGAPGAPDSALVFQARVGDRELEGCDFIHVNDEGLIDELFVMIRPATGLMALAEAMKRQLEGASTSRPRSRSGGRARRWPHTPPTLTTRPSGTRTSRLPRGKRHRRCRSGLGCIHRPVPRPAPRLHLPGEGARSRRAFRDEHRRGPVPDGDDLHVEDARGGATKMTLRNRGEPPGSRRWRRP